MHSVRRALVLLALVAPLPALAEGKAVVGAAVARARLETSVAGAPLRVEDDGFRLHVGWHFAKFFGVEGSYLAPGSPHAASGATSFRTDLNAYEIAAVGMVPVGPVRLFARAGVARWRSDETTTVLAIPATARARGTDALYGAGVAFHLLPLLWLRAEYERVETGGGRKLDAGSLGLELRF